jgi:DNA-binding NtrC family response regulator
MKKDKILIIEDNLVWRESYKKWLGKEYEYRDVTEAPGASPAFDQFLPNLVILDLGIPTIEQGFDTLDKIITKGTDAQIIVITASKDHKDALQAQRRGAHAYFFKGEDIKEELPLLVRRALKMQALERENKKLRKKLEDAFNFENIVAVSKQMNSILNLIEKISSSRESVLILGESGVGKEVIARHIHTRSICGEGPFIAINCAAMPENLLENELFGHEKGAFTGALNLKKGRLELAASGTLFLDEIGDMPVTLQAKLLRVLQDKKFYRLGGTKEIYVELRLIAATNKKLNEEVKNNRFREDLYYRLNVIPIDIPPLRERPDDIPALIDFFTQKYCQDNNLPIPRIENALISFLSRLNWPGNVRQLENTLKRMLVLNHNTLSISDIPADIKQSSNSLLNNALIQQQTLEKLSSSYVKLVLDHFKGNKKKTYTFLGINYRTLQRKLSDK